jgi:hypothetical protein
MHPETILSDLHDKLAVNGIEPFVLIEVQMPRWPAFRMERVLENEKPIAVPRYHFELDDTDPESTMLSGTIVSGLNDVSTALIIRPMR